MMGNSHRLLAAGSWVAFTGFVPGHYAWQVPAGAVLAAAFAAGPTSPDVDNTRMWKRLDRWLPDEWLGEGGPLQHRGVTHWIGWPLIAAALLLVAETRQVVAPWDGDWWMWAVVVGVASHLVGDFLVGQQGYGTEQGIPLMPWWGHVGLGLKCGGPTELALTPLAAAALTWWGLDLPALWSPHFGPVVVEFARAASSWRP